ncbi:MAG: 3-methyladenine DNA glycosylase [Helicobacter sp.]|nr:3-methyladenine DNA glycosylase [Helicobacter sp.]
MDAFAIFASLRALDLLKESTINWWDDAEMSIIVGVILTQNTKWQNVQKSLLNLKATNLLNANNEKSLQNLASAHPPHLEPLIQSSGFYRQKSANIILLCQNIINHFGDFETFYKEASREFLLQQRGIGKESADSILCYALKRDVLVVDKYTARLCAKLGMEFFDYDELQSFLQNGILDNLHLFNFTQNTQNPQNANKTDVLNYKNLNNIYARFHGKIVEFSKKFKLNEALDLI